MSVLRIGLVGSAAAALTGVLTAQIRPTLAAAGSGGPDDLVAAGCLLAALLVGLWLSVGVLVAALALLPGASGRALAVCERAVTPRLVGRLVRLAAGAGVASALTCNLMPAATAADAPPGSRPHNHAAVLGRSQPPASHDDGSWIPVLDRQVHLPTDRGQPRREATSHLETYVVRPGDTLWGIAAAALPGSPSAAEVATAWPLWWRLNRHVVGEDPNLIRPGQVLRVPRGAS